MEKLKKLVSCVLIISTFMFVFTGSIGAMEIRHNINLEKPSDEELKEINNYFESSEVIDGEIIYTYNYEGLKIQGNSILTGEEVLSLVNSIDNQKHEGEITPMYIPDPGYLGTVVAGPKYTHYKNTDVVEAVNAITAWLGTKIPVKYSKSALFNYCLNKLTGWASSAIKETYVGTWTTKSYSRYNKLYEYRATLVHFSDSTYNKPLQVQYWVAGYAAK